MDFLLETPHNPKHHVERKEIWSPEDLIKTNIALHSAGPKVMH